MLTYARARRLRSCLIFSLTLHTNMLGWGELYLPLRIYLSSLFLAETTAYLWHATVQIYMFQTTQRTTLSASMHSPHLFFIFFTQLTNNLSRGKRASHPIKKPK